MTSAQGSPKEYSWVGGHWVLPNIDTVGGLVKAHVSVAVGHVEEFGTSDIDLEVWAGDSFLPARVRPSSENPFMFTQTRSIGAAAFFEFDNPTGQAPTIARVTLLGEQLTFDVSAQDPPPIPDPGSLPMV